MHSSHGTPPSAAPLADSRDVSSDEGCLHWLLEEQAAKSPDAIAVEAGGAALSYRALDARANRLARHRRGRGVGPGAFVGLWAERSLDALVGILGVLKAGGAYVPMGPNWPADRARHVLADANVHTLLAGPDEAARVP